MNILGVIDITPKEIRDFISIAREHVGKEKNATCFVLAAQNETILEWYKSLNEKFNRERIEIIRDKLEKRINDEEVRKFRGEISEYTHDRVYKPIIEQSIQFLRSYAPNSTHYRKRIREYLFKNEQGPDEKIEHTKKLILKIIELERQFSFHVFASKLQFEMKLYGRDSKGSLDPYKFIEFLIELDSIREKLSRYISLLQFEIGCTTDGSMSFYHNKLKRNLY